MIHGEIFAHDAQTPLILALDIGTSSVRAALFDGRGFEINGTQTHIARTFQATADGGAELNADVACAEVARVIDGTLASVENDVALSKQNIAGVGVSCFWHSLVGIDKEGKTITPVLGWADTRSAGATKELKRIFDEREMHARTGCRFHSSYWTAKLLYLQYDASCGARFDVKKIARWMSLSEYIAKKFCGDDAMQTSVSMASATGIFNQRECTWDAKLLAFFNLTVENLSPLAEDDAAFSLNEFYAQRWKQLADAKWFPAIGDGAANNVGADCVTRERAALMIGTSGAMRVLFEGGFSSVESLPAGLWSYRLDRRRIIVGGALSDGGGLRAWLTNALNFKNEINASHTLDSEALERALEAIAPDAHGLTLLPFWAGERSTGWHADARGAILGLSMHTTAHDILRAAMEAVAYRFAAMYEQLDTFAPHARIIASGGGVECSRVWSQILADVLNRPLQVSTAHEASSRGAALFALEKLGVISNLENVTAAFALDGEMYIPNATHHAVYVSARERHEKFYNLLVNH